MISPHEDEVMPPPDARSVQTTSAAGKPRLPRS
ncbi:MAG: hypothetical protein ACKOTE_08610, partial [Opitutaceae bacterium]